MTELNPVATARALQRFCRERRITPYDLAVGMALLWSCRAPGAAACMVSFTRLAKLAGVGRSTAVEAVRKLRDLGVLIREKTRLRVTWALGIASRQGRNIYRWAKLATEAATPPTDQMQVRKQAKEALHRGGAAPLPVPKRGGLEAALASLGARLGTTRM